MIFSYILLLGFSAKSQCVFSGKEFGDCWLLQKWHFHLECSLGKDSYFLATTQLRQRRMILSSWCCMLRRTGSLPIIFSFIKSRLRSFILLLCIYLELIYFSLSNLGYHGKFVGKRRKEGSPDLCVLEC